MSLDQAAFIEGALSALGYEPHQIVRVKGRVVIYAMVRGKPEVIATSRAWDRLRKEVPGLKNAELPEDI